MTAGTYIGVKNGTGDKDDNNIGTEDGLVISLYQVNLPLIAHIQHTHTFIIVTSSYNFNIYFSRSGFPLNPAI